MSTDSSNNDPFVSVVIPCFNEAGNIQELYEQLKPVITEYSNHEILFVDDGSSDETARLVDGLSSKDSAVKLIQLSRNFGHQAALKAGLDNAEGDCVISLDADLQHPPELIPDLIKKWKEGYEVVFTQREEDPNLSWMKRSTSKFFYRIAQRLTSVKIHQGSADFRLLDKEVIEVLKQLDESYLFIRGLVSWVGFKQTAISYKASYRFSGTTNYTYRKMFSLALSGITSFSIRPLQLSIILGLVIATLAGVYGLYVIYIFAFTNNALPGWASTTASVLFIGGVQLIMLGILGEYVGKGFIEGKHRPNYVIRKKKR
ncbi:MAG: glycosyltransferase involved in cell wall biosynthesis [Bacteroidia bacterium]|jgi:glycosyltransferase involved in cell wall biosynthesis